MTKSRLLLRDLLVNMAFFLWMFAVGAVLAYWPYQSMPLVYALAVMLIPYGLFWLIRRFCKKIILFILLHIAVVAAGSTIILMWPAVGLLRPFGEFQVNFYTICRMLLLLAMTLYSLISRFSASREPLYDTGTLIFFMVSMAALCILCEHYEYPALTGLLTAVTASLLLLYFLFGQMHSLDYSMEVSGHSASQPVSAILSFNNRLIAGFVLFLSVAAIAAYLFGLGGGLLSLFLWLGRGLRVVLRFLFGLLPTGEEPTEAYVAPVEEGGDDMLAMLGEAAYKPTPLFLVILEKIFIFAGTIIAVAAVLGALIYGCYKLYRLFYGKKRLDASYDLKESVLPDVREMIRARFAFSGEGPANRIRRLFYRKVRRHILRKTAAETISDSDTASEIAQKIKASEDIDALTERYAQARYYH